MTGDQQAGTTLMGSDTLLYRGGSSDRGTMRPTRWRRSTYALVGFAVVFVVAIVVAAPRDCRRQSMRHRRACRSRYLTRSAMAAKGEHPDRELSRPSDTGKALTGRALAQAKKFGADIVFPARVEELVP